MRQRTANANSFDTKPPAKPKPERSLYERLRDYPLEPLCLSPQELAALRRQEAWWQEARRTIDRASALFQTGRRLAIPLGKTQPNPWN